VNKFDSFFALTSGPSSKNFILNYPIILLLLPISFVATAAVMSFFESSINYFLKMLTAGWKFSNVDDSRPKNSFRVIRFSLNG
jgi:hypothetical protein